MNKAYHNDCNKYNHYTLQNHDTFEHKMSVLVLTSIFRGLKIKRIKLMDFISKYLKFNLALFNLNATQVTTSLDRCKCMRISHIEVVSNQTLGHIVSVVM